MRGGTVRAAGTVILVLAALLGSAYGLGRSLVPDPPSERTGVPASVTRPDYADQPPTVTESPAAPTASPEASTSGPTPAGGRRTYADAAGPFGTQVSTGSPRVALTFDDGPDPQYTPEVLALLREHGVKATFCVVGENVQSHPDLIQAIVADGHTLCNHSWHHDVTLGSRPPDAIRDDLLRTNAAIRAAVPNAAIAYFRQPGGAWTDPVVSVSEELGMTPLHWAVDPSDWKSPGAAMITAAVLGGIAPGSIVLMHDAGGDRQGTVEALQSLLPALLARFQLEALPSGTT
ncbi:Polysaccharide deacetylase [Micromonospora rhizosphaerae]|uniref:Polysaccharide deacetylase n=1 Tax=Micromonospora rhizosphaerae TaxID=568872 RepID=A0A1C6RAN2_9ACTN|nr:polysaccharide deacetylase family protein [Micromonospora rhizosphaerae]SCL14158.1 Polysaccharide deacetylase [Micromonospora rhizosphaerae]